MTLPDREAEKLSDLGILRLIFFFPVVHDVVWPKLAPMGELGIGNSIYRVSPTLFQAAVATPYYIQHGMTCMALTHQRNRVRHDETQEKALVTTFLHFRGKMIHSLSDDISNEEKRTGSLVFAGILQLLIADVSLCSIY